MKGLLHKTSLQVAQEQQHAVLPPKSVAGQKRSWSASKDGGQHTPGQPSFAPGTVQFQRAISLPSTASPLCASKIANVVAHREVSEYTQRRLIFATPSSSRDPELDLAHPTYDLPRSIVLNFSTLGINSIYPWQKNCLKGPGLLAGGRNLVYCAPTGGGKSLVADCEPNYPRYRWNFL